MVSFSQGLKSTDDGIPFAIHKTTKIKLQFSENSDASLKK